MRIEEMIERKKELGYSAKLISELSGVPLSTVQKIFSGHTKRPRYDTIRALTAVLRFETPEHAADRAIVREEAFAYGGAVRAERGNGDDDEQCETKKAFRQKKQGEYTLEDYYALPDERRVELIDGVIYDMTAPTEAHQVVVGFLHAELWNYVVGNRGKCVVNMAPTDVHLDTKDDQTMIQPDVLVTCDRSKTAYLRVEGAPDLVIEVLSPSTRKKDLYIKVSKYESAGVRELWLVDPRDRRVIVYDFEHKDTVGIYTFRDAVPVGIFDGGLAIDFAWLSGYLDELFGDAWYER